jgi:hypothetical protein
MWKDVEEEVDLRNMDWLYETGCVRDGCDDEMTTG